MYRPQKLAAAFLSAALLCTTGIALADKGNHGNPHGGPPGQSNSAPGQSNGNGQGQGAGGRGPAGIGGPRSAPGPTMGNAFGRNNAIQGDIDSKASAHSSFNRAGEQAEIKIVVNGSAQAFAIAPAALKALQAHGNQKNLIFFTTNGKDITAISAIGEKMNMRVVSRSGDTFTLQSADGQSRLIKLDAKTAARLRVKVGAMLQLTAMSAESGRVVALDLMKSHDFDKFAAGTRRGGVDAVKTDIDRAKTDVDVAAKTKKAKQADIDALKLDIDIVKADLGNAKTKKSKKLDNDVAKLDNDERTVEASSGCGHSSARSGNPAFANQMAKDAANDASGHNPPGLPHECVNPAGHTRGFCKSGGSASICGGGSGGSAGESVVASASAGGSTKAHGRNKQNGNGENNDNEVAANASHGRGKCGPSGGRNGNPAFANQMAKDAANDASGHNPPGLPHECVNPAGHTRGFCKSTSSEGICAGGSGGSAGESVVASANTGGSTKVHGRNGQNGNGENQIAANLSKPCAPGSSSKSRTNPAFANQMAKDAANDASGHNPPGLPHECVNPAGHTRGFCKTSESNSSALCGGSSGGGIAPSDLHGGIAARGESTAAGSAATRANLPGTGAGTGASVAGSGGTTAAAARARGFAPSANGGLRGPGAPVGFVPGPGSSSNGGTRGATRGAAGAPTHVLGASAGPTSGRRIAALPMRVLPVAIQPVGKRRCVWYKTAVLGASTGPHYIVGTSATSGKPVLRKKCR